MKPTDPVSVSPVKSHWFYQSVLWWREGVGGREWRRAAGRCLITDTTWIDQKGGCNSSIRHWQCVLYILFEGDSYQALYLNYKLDCISITKFFYIYIYHSYWMQHHCWNAQTSAFLLAVRSVSQRNDDFAAITSWCWGYEHGASEELLTVHGYPVVGVVPADSVSSSFRD